MAEPLVDVQIQEKKVSIRGVCTIETISGVAKVLQEQVTRVQEVACEAVTEADSSFLALLLWLQAQIQPKKLKVTGVPNEVLTLQQLYDLTDILSIEARPAA